MEKKEQRKKEERKKEERKYVVERWTSVGFVLGFVLPKTLRQWLLVTIVGAFDAKTTRCSENFVQTVDAA
jgi:hypothetical protein